MRLADTGADGLVPISSLPSDFYDHDERNHSLVGRRWGRTYRLGERVAVRRQIAQDLSRLSRERPRLEAIRVERHRVHEIVVRVGRQRDVGEHGAVARRERASVEWPAAQILVAEGHEVGAPDVAESAAGERMYRISPA